MAEETEGRVLEHERLQRGVAAVLHDPGKGIYYVAEVAGEVVGQMLITYEWSDWRDGTFWWIQSVYVKPAARGQGIFKALFAHAQKLTRERKDVCGLRLYVDAHNASAKKIYEKLGMKRTDYEVYELDFILRAPNSG